MSGIPRGRFLALVLCLHVTAVAAQDQTVQVHTQLSYAPSEAASQPDPQRSLDLLVPPGANAKTPVMVFVAGGFWKTPPQEFIPANESWASVLEQGVAVAIPRFRNYPDHDFRAALSDIDAAVRFLSDNLDQYRLSNQDMHLVGHGSGAQLLALWAADQFANDGDSSLPPLASMILMSGIYDLTDWRHKSAQLQEYTRDVVGKEGTVLRAMSPLKLPAGSKPFPVYVFNAEQDFPGFTIEGRRFAEQQREAGHGKAYHYVVAGVDHFSMLDWHKPGNTMGTYLKKIIQPQDASGDFLQAVFEARQHWQPPPVDYPAYWKSKELITTRPIDASLAHQVVTLFKNNEHLLSAYPSKTYSSIDLVDWLKHRFKDLVLENDYVITTNLRNEKLFWKLSEIIPYQPEIVIGVDDVKNLYSMVTFYKTKKQYSWKDNPPQPLFARPLGPFIHFRKEPPARYKPAFFANYSINPDGFEIAKQDPLAMFRSLDEKLENTIVYKNGCPSCHLIKDVGTRSFHTTAIGLEPHGGFALPILSYPPQVWKRFVFQQAEAAATIGVAPNVLDKDIQQPLYDYMNSLKE